MSNFAAEANLQDVNATTRRAAVAIAICSWVAITNHCAFAAVASEIDNAHTECPFHSKPAKQKKQSSHVECCRVLRAIISVQPKCWVRDDGNFSAAILFVEEDAPFAFSSHAFVPLQLDTGPPKSRSFAELILQHSLLAHAPPRVA